MSPVTHVVSRRQYGGSVVPRTDAPGGGDTIEEPDLPAGSFSSWLRQIGKGERDGRGMAVPCGECSACCTSSQFIHVEPDEARTIARIPPGLLFPAPGAPRGTMVMGYDENGHCPMFVEGRCSIYEDRPRTCRAYDCRVLPAAGVEMEDDDKSAIIERTRRWRFDFPAAEDRELHAACQAAAAFLRDHAADLPDGLVPRHPTQLAFLAVRIHDLFLGPVMRPGDGSPVAPSLDQVETAVRRHNRG
jgi:Fe-S-cluster containining protein